MCRMRVHPSSGTLLHSARGRYRRHRTILLIDLMEVAVRFCINVDMVALQHEIDVVPYVSITGLSHK